MRLEEDGSMKELSEVTIQEMDAMIGSPCGCMSRETWAEEIGRATHHVVAAVGVAARLEVLCPRGIRELMEHVIMEIAPHLGSPGWLRDMADRVALAQAPTGGSSH